MIMPGCIGLVKCKIVIVCLGRQLCLSNMNTVAIGLPVSVIAHKTISFTFRASSCYFWPVK